MEKLLKAISVLTRKEMKMIKGGEEDKTQEEATPQTQYPRQPTQP